MLFRSVIKYSLLIFFLIRIFILYHKKLFKYRQSRLKLDLFNALTLFSFVFLQYKNEEIINKKARVNSWFLWQGLRESNSHQRFWRPVYYHYTKPLCCINYNMLYLFYQQYFFKILTLQKNNHNIIFFKFRYFSQ